MFCCVSISKVDSSYIDVALATRLFSWMRNQIHIRHQALQTDKVDSYGSIDLLTLEEKNHKSTQLHMFLNPPNF